MVNLDLLFNAYPDIESSGLQCSSLWVQTTTAENEDGTFDVRGVLSLK